MRSTPAAKRTYPEGSPFIGTIGANIAASQEAWPVLPTPGPDAPNVVMVILDDVGFAQLGSFGGLGGRIETPAIDVLAADGLRYSNFHAAAMCSPTRASLMTGRNHHSVGIGMIMERATGYPGYNARIPKNAAMIPRVLQLQGYSTLSAGKWHLTPPTETTPAGPFLRWPLGQGFDRFYGFLGADDDHFNPNLYEDNHRVPRRTGKEDDDYHLSSDLVDKSVSWIRERKMVTPSKPFFLHLAFGAAHSPHHAPADWIRRYEGRFDAGWDVIREETLARQIEMGLVPPGTSLPDRNPGVRSWAELTDDERRLYARQMEVFAAFVAHTDHQIGRLVDSLQALGQLDNTLFMVVSDNGASAEGGPDGISSENRYYNGVRDKVEEMLPLLDAWGGPTTSPHYATGWAMAGNTPNRLYKSFCHEGGTRVPLIVHWPRAITDRGGIRTQFHSPTDLAATVLDVAGTAMPDVVDGHPQLPFDGTTMRYSFDDADAPTTRSTQYFEMFGHRAMWKDGWKAVTLHWSKAIHTRLGQIDHPLNDGDFDADVWELYHTDTDVAEVHDRAQDMPERLKELVDLWWEEAGRHQVLPLDDRLAERSMDEPDILEPRDCYRYDGPVHLDMRSTPVVRNTSHSILVRADVADPTTGGVLVADGGPDGGYLLCVQDSRVVYVSNALGKEFTVLRSATPLAAGAHEILLEFDQTAPHAGSAHLSVDGRPVAEADVPRTNAVTYGLQADGLRIGRDVLMVWPEYDGPAEFAGRVETVEIRRGDGPSTDPDAELRMALHRQ
ncbi:arylsulfatase [Streptomyces longhuiensis]|uniref:arylsulfatase n=1 Tax=Streptomyces TaxID=1883 RepID=UPI001D0A4BE1|nr:arylsulfatase [Streptomyces longhuiensis]UDL97087.1 arylsulfatase [Streptomyces longhuiensis]